MRHNLITAASAQYEAHIASGEGTMVFDSALKCHVPSVKLYGKCTQASTPTPDAPVDILHNNGQYRWVGKNVLNLPSYSGTWGGTSATYDAATGVFTLNGNSNKSYVTNMISLPFPLTGEFTFSAHYVGGTISNGNFWLAITSRAYDISTNNALRLAIYGTGFDKTYAHNTIKGAKYLVCQYSGDGDLLACNNYQVRIMIESGSTETEYEPYYDGGSVLVPDLYGLPNSGVVDEWDAVTGNGVRKCGVIILDGTSHVFSYGNSNDQTCRIFKIPVENAMYVKRSLPISTHFKPYVPTLTVVGSTVSKLTYGEFLIYNNEIYLTFPLSYTVSDVNAWLAENPVTIVYQLRVTEPFYSTPTKFVQPIGKTTLLQSSGDVHDAPAKIKYISHC